MNSRAILYLLYHPEGILPEYVIFKLQRLRPHADYIRVVVNGTLDKSDIKQLKTVVDAVQLRNNTGLDVGAYKDAILDIGFDELSKFDELILMNYTWFGPIGTFDEVFERMDSENVDFWGMTEHAAVTPNPITGKGTMRSHLQSHWIAIRKPMLSSPSWKSYWQEMPFINNYSESILKHESRFTGHFSDLGFSYKAAFPQEKYGVDHAAFVCADQLMKDGCPVLKRRPFFHDPLYLDAEAIIGKDLVETASSLGYPEELIWKDIVPLTPPKILNTNASQLEILPDVALTNERYQGRVAAVTHIYYEDMTAELLDRLSLIPGIVDVFVTTTDEVKKEFIQQEFNSHSWTPNHFEIRVLSSNRGRDLSGYFIGCRDVVTDEKYDLIFKIHSKKTVQRGATAGEFFKKQQIENLLNSEGFARNLVSLFERDPQLGIVFPPTIHIGYPTLGMAWFTNKEPAQEYADELGIKVPFDDISPLGALGAMWVCRPNALSFMTSKHYEFDDYMSEDSHGDGSLAHVQERLVSYAAAAAGYKTKTVANSRYISISHTFLEYKLDQALAIMPGYALHTINAVRAQVWDSDSVFSTLSKRQFLKQYLQTHHKRTGRLLRLMYLPVRFIKLKIIKFDGTQP